MIINHNMNAMNAHRMMAGNTTASGKSMEKLSSGLRINRAGDDAAGLAISEKMRGQIRGLDQAQRNSQDAISSIQTAEGALNETHSILQRMRELAVQASNDTNNTNDRGQIQKEINQLTSEINRIGNTTEFNTMKLLNGEKSDQHVIGSAVQTNTIVLSGTKSIATAKGLTDGASSLDLASKITVATSSGDGFSWNSLSATSGVNTVTIGKNAAGQLEVSIKANDGAGSETFSSIDKVDITWDSNNEFKFDSHGISFTVKKSDFDAASTTTTKVVDLFLANNSAATVSGAQIDTQNSWTTNDGMKISDGITIDASKLPSGLASAAASIELSATSGAAGGNNIGSLTVRIKDASGNVLMSDTATSAGTDQLKYDNMGISFTLSGTASQVSASLKFDLADYKKTSATTVYTTKDDSLTFQVGANENQSMSVGISDMRAKALGITGSGTGFTADSGVTNGTNNTVAEKAVDVSNATNASKAVTTIQAAIDKVSDERSKLGAYQNRLEHTIANLGTSSENLQSAESRIRDVDMAKEMMSFSKNNILSQAAQAMLAQANQQPQGVLQLLR